MSRYRYQQPANEDAFEEFCLLLLRDAWKLPSLDRYGHRGERQNGVDLFDTGGSKPVRAVQCKHHDSTKTLSPAELESEVIKARKFPEKIDEYFVATTAKKGRRAQIKVKQLNEEHRRRGLFLVQLLTWDDLERLIDDSAAAQAALNLKTVDALAQAIRPLAESIRHQSSDLHRHEMDDAKSWLGKGQPKLASAVLARVRERGWADFGSAQKSRWCTLEADAQLRMGNRDAAARLLVEARTLTPDDERAYTNEVAGRQAIGDLAGARRVAEEARRRFPSSASATALSIELAATADEVRELVAALPAFIASAPEVVLAIAFRHELGSQAELAARASARDTNDPRAWFALAMCLFVPEIEKANPWAASGAASIPLRDRLEEAKACLQKVIASAEDSGHTAMEVSARSRRAMVSGFLGQWEECRADTEAAYRKAPNEPEAILGAARFAVERSNHAEAVRLLAQLSPKHVCDETEFLSGVALWNRNEPGDREEALRRLEVVGSGNSPHSAEAAELVVRGYVATAHLPEADKFVARLQASIDPTLAAVLRARIALAAGNQQDAGAAADAGVRAVADTTPRFATDSLAKLLMALSRPAEALPLLQRLAVPGPDLEPGRRLVDCARRIGRDAVVLDYCRTARKAGVRDEFLMQAELALLDEYDPSAAMDLLRELLSENPALHGARVHLVTLALRLGLQEVAHEHEPYLPSVTVVDAAEGAAVVAALHQLGHSDAASRYAYDLLRLNFGSHHAHRAFRNTVMWRDRSNDDVIELEDVRPGAAVRLAEGSDEWWFVLEDSPIRVEGVQDEIRANSTLAMKMIGKRCGDAVVLSTGPGINRAAIVKEIVPKEVFRIRDVWKNWQLRFPDQQEMWMVRVDRPDGRPDFSQLLELLEHNRTRDAEAEALLASKPLPVHVFGQLVGKDDVHAIGHIACTERLPLRCCIGSQDEHREAETALRSANDIVVDLTAFGTLVMLGELDRLESMGKNIVVSPAALAAIRHFEAQLRMNCRSSASAGSTPEGPTLVTRSDEQNEATARFVEKLQGLVGGVFRLSGAREVASVDPVRRGQLAQIIGVAGLESAVLGGGQFRVLWTDDIAVAAIAREMFGARRVWTQVVFRWLFGEGRVPLEVYERVSAMLVAWGYTFTSTSQGILRTTGTTGGWNVEAFPLRQGIAYLSLPEVSLSDALQLGALLVSDAYRFSSLTDGRRLVLLRVAQSIESRPDFIERALDEFARLLPRVFGVNLLGLDDALATFVAWRRAGRRGIVLPFAAPDRSTGGGGSDE